LLKQAVLFAAARPISIAFGTQHVDLTVEFVRVFGIGVAAFSVSRTMRGGLRGAGDTRWPLYATLTGAYLVRLPVAALALPASYAVGVGSLSVAPGLGLGLPAVFVALVGDFYGQAAINTIRFRSGRWKAVARRAGVAGAGDD